MIRDKTIRHDLDEPEARDKAAENRLPLLARPQVFGRPLRKGRRIGPAPGSLEIPLPSAPGKRPPDRTAASPVNVERT